MGVFLKKIKSSSSRCTEIDRAESERDLVMKAFLARVTLSREREQEEAED